MKVFAAVLVVGFISVLVSPVIAQDQSARGAMLIILDASGSMNASDEDGVPFIDKAKTAVYELIDALPDDLDVGLRVYGHREPNTDPTRGCRDTELVAPVLPLDRAAIGTALDGIEASGYTPIGLSLQLAADDLPETGPRSIVLISDGVDTCSPPDPCEVAEDLYGEAIDVRIESIGFLVDTGSAAEQQLRCIAERSGGEYRTVGRADELIGKLGEVATGVLDWRPPMALNGALDRLEAPQVPLTTIPDWLDQEPPTFARGEYASVIMPGETRWFRVETWTGEGFWVYAGLEGPPGTEIEGEFEAILIDPSGNDGAAPTSGLPMRTALPDSDRPMIGVQNADPPQGGPRPPGTYLLGFHWDAPADVYLGSLHFNVDILGDYREAEVPTVQGSLNSTDAPLLELTMLEENGPNWRGGGFYGPISAGETRWYRIETESGDEINAFALFPANRVVGTGLEGTFGIEMLDLSGDSVGTALGEAPQTTEDFGADTRQARVSISTEQDQNPSGEGILIGLTWDGSEGDSQIRFHVEKFSNPSRTQNGKPASEDEKQVVATPDQQPGDQAPDPVAAPTDASSTQDAGTNVAVVLVVAVVLAAVAVVVTVRIKGRKQPE